jgi:hypothetical protein
VDNNESSNKEKEATLMKKLDLDGTAETGSRIDAGRKLEDDFFSLSTLSMDDKVQRFLLHAVELAKQVSMLLNFFSLLLTMRPNKPECLYVTATFQSSLTFAGNIRSLPKKETAERSSNWVCSGLALKF